MALITIHMGKINELSHSQKMREKERIGLRNTVMDDYWKYRADASRPAVRRGGPCEWCARFGPLNFNVCMNCGNILGGKGAF